VPGPPQELGEHLALLTRYLSDEVAPLVFSEALDALLDQPPLLVAAEIRAWVAAQYRGAEPLPVSDYLFHTVRKLHVVGELGLVAADRLRDYLAALGELLLEQCPEPDRDALAADLAHLDESRAVLAAPVQIVHRPGGGEPARPPAGRREAGQRSGAAPPPPPAAGVALPERVVQGLRRLDLLLDRLEREPGTADLQGAAQEALLARILAAAAANASDPAALDDALERLRRRGIDTGTRRVLRLVGRALPEWSPPPAGGIGGPPSTEAAAALRHVVTLGRDRAELARRFTELVQAACEEINTGSLGRAVTMLDLAERMVAEEKVDAMAVREARSGAWSSLDPERLRSLAETQESHQLLRSVFAFFSDLSVDRLLDELSGEQRRDRRRLLLLLLIVHGAPARAAAIERLRAIATGATWADWYVERNLLHLLRRMPAPPGAALDPELDVLVRLSQPGAPLPVVKEAIAVLAQHRHPRAEQALIARVGELEDGLLGVKQLPYEQPDLTALLDRLVRSLARTSSPAAHRCVVDHGLRRRPQLGDTLARLADLGAHDLAAEPELVERLLKALRDELPPRVLGITMQTRRRTAAAAQLIAALSGTRSPQVRELLEEIATRFAGQPFGADAQRVLEASVADVRQEKPPLPTLTGDLGLFGLPTLLQNLAESQVNGTLSLLDAGAEPVASLRLARGNLVEVVSGRLEGPTALYATLERRQVDRFVFVNAAASPADPAGSPVLPLIMEGVRRLDEYQRAAAVVPDGALVEPAGAKPSRLADEPDVELMRAVWQRAVAGATPREVESEAAVDPYRVRRLLEHWVEEGSLRLR